ncbi:MAG: hypothetical protein ACRDY0_13190 [Acidimicrobiales bacterium]
MLAMIPVQASAASHQAAPPAPVEWFPSFWEVMADGTVYGPTFHAAIPHLNAPIVGMASTPDGGGYWLVAGDGGVFGYGDATFHGSMAATALHAPVVGITATSGGAGYRLDGSDGGVFTFGDASFFGASPQARGTIVGALMPTPDGHGYWLAVVEEGCQAFGDAHPCISASARPPIGPGHPAIVYPPAVGAAADEGHEMRLP